MKTSLRIKLFVESHEHRADVMPNGHVRIAIVETLDGAIAGHSIHYAEDMENARFILGY
ncbi:MAG: hypothetical protein AAFU85_17215 [Planctomycetota bacterium]